MARKKEPKVIHPVTMLESLEAFKTDANALYFAAHNILSFLDRGDSDAGKVLKAGEPMLREAAERFARWNQAED